MSAVIRKAVLAMSTSMQFMLEYELLVVNYNHESMSFFSIRAVFN